MRRGKGRGPRAAGNKPLTCGAEGIHGPALFGELPEQAFFRFYFKNGGKGFWGGHSDEVFTSLSAEDADTQAVVFKIPESVCSSLDELHFSVKAFSYSVVLREAEHPGNLFFPRIQRAPQRTHRLERTAAQLIYISQKTCHKLPTLFFILTAYPQEFA